MIFLDDAKNEITKILDQIDFDNFYKKGDIYENFYNIFNFAKDDFVLRSGLVKGVLVSKNTPYVYKFNLTNKGFDYCENEYKVYQAAVAAGLDTYFAEEEIIVYKGIVVTIQEQVISFDERYGEYAGTPSGKYTDYNAANEMPAEWIADFIDAFGEDSFYDLLTFLEKEDVNDLHSGNIGYIDYAPILFDYSGWYD